MAKNKGKGKSSVKDLLRQLSGSVGPTSRHQQRHQIRSEVRLAYGPQQRELMAERRASNQRVHQLGGWFQDYQNQLKALQGQTAGAFNAAQGQVAQTAQNTANYSEQLRQQLASEGQASAAQRGATYSQAPDAAAQAANVSRLNTSGTYSNLLAGQGANQQAYEADKRRIAGGTLIDQRLAEQARGRSVDTDIKKLAGDKRALMTDLIDKKQQTDRDFYLGLLQAQIGKQNAKRSAKVSASNARRSARTSAANSRRTAASAAASRAQNQSQFDETHNRRGQSRGTVPHGGSSGSNNKPARNKEIRQIKTLFHNNVQVHGFPSDQASAIKWLLKQEGISDAPLVKHVVKRLFKHHRHHRHHGGSQPTGSGGHPGPVGP